ncbi:hypothetical protein D3C71_898740 [compost metagenome]
MTVVEDGVVGAVGLDDVVQGLCDEHGLDPVAAHQAQRLLEESEPSQQRELVHDHQQLAPLVSSGGVTLFLSGQGLSRRIEEQPHQGPKRRRIRRRHLDIKRQGRVGAHQIAHSEVRGGQNPFHVLARQPLQIGPRRPLDRGAEPVMHGRIALHRGLDERMGLRLAVRSKAMQGLEHDVRRLVEVGQQFLDLQQGLVLILGGIEDMQDHRLEDLRGRLVPDSLLVARPAGIGQNGDQPLHLGQFARSGPDLRQGIPPRRSGMPGRQIEGVGKP